MEKMINVKVKLGEETFPPWHGDRLAPDAVTCPPPRVVVDGAAHNDTVWKCHKCAAENLVSKSRCGSCQSWRGGKREGYVWRGTRNNISGERKPMMQAPFAVETEEQSSTKARALPADEKNAHQGEKESQAFTNKKDQNSKKNEKIEKYHDNGKTDQRKEKKEAATTRTEKKKKRERTGKDDKSHKSNQNNQEDVEEVKEEVEISMGARLPKRKRTNLYSSLSPAVIQATP